MRQSPCALLTIELDDWFPKRVVILCIIQRYGLGRRADYSRGWRRDNANTTESAVVSIREESPARRARGLIGLRRGFLLSTRRLLLMIGRPLSAEAFSGGDKYFYRKGMIDHVCAVVWIVLVWLCVTFRVLGPS